MNKWRAAGAGVTGALVVSGIAAIARGVGMPVNLELMLGSAILREVSTAAWLVGWMMQLAGGSILGLLYGLVLAQSDRLALETGVSIGAIHGVLSGIALTAMPALHPLMPATMPAPGMFMSELGISSAVLFVALHLVFGAIVAGIYEGRVATRRLARSS